MYLINYYQRQEPPGGQSLRLEILVPDVLPDIPHAARIAQDEGLLAVLPLAVGVLLLSILQSIHRTAGQPTAANISCVRQFCTACKVLCLQ